MVDFRKIEGITDARRNVARSECEDAMAGEAHDQHYEQDEPRTEME
jgi:hypothetical protein